MSERKPPPSPDELEARLEKAREELDRREGRGAMGGQQGAVGIAVQVAIEMVGALAVAVGIGWVLDRWLATRPLFLVIFFFLGAAAGGLNVYRRAQQITGGDANGEKPENGSPSGRKEKE
ncbi:MAG: AtpZ/AtpI family protein [Alphaproteobacteria bacterium]